MSDITTAPLVERYAKLVLLQQDLYALHTRFKETRDAESASMNPPGKPFNRDRSQFRLAYPLYLEMLARADDLLEHLITHFPAPTTPEAIDETKYVIDDYNTGRRPPFDPYSVEDLQSVMDTVIPVFIARHMLSIEKLPLDNQRMKYFETFAEVYREIVLEGKARPTEQVVEMFPEWAASQPSPLKDYSRSSKGVA